VNIDNVYGAQNITNMWQNCFSELFNINNEILSENAAYCVFDDNMIVSVREVDDCIRNAKCRKATGPDGLTSENFKYASQRVSTYMACLFSSMFIHGYMPIKLIAIEYILVPIVKNKCASITSKDNYRPIALANIVTKSIENIIIERIDEHLRCSPNQFGFEKQSGTDQCIYMFKELVNVYNDAGSTVFCCFLDASKAFDRVNHVKLMNKLGERGIPQYIVRLLNYWYANQTLRVRWGSCISNSIAVTNGVRQGGILSPRLFNIYMDALSIKLQSKRIGLSYCSGQVC